MSWIQNLNFGGTSLDFRLEHLFECPSLKVCSLKNSAVRYFYATLMSDNACSVAFSRKSGEFFIHISVFSEHNVLNEAWNIEDFFREDLFFLNFSRVPPGHSLSLTVHTAAIDESPVTKGIALKWTFNQRVHCVAHEVSLKVECSERLCCAQTEHFFQQYKHHKMYHCHFLLQL